MPKITLENTSAAKAADLAGRVSQFQGNALAKLNEIQSNLVTKGTSGKLRIIYTTKSNKDLQFETRNRKWWGGLYTPSEGRQEKNKIALRELFNKAGQDLSESRQKEFGIYLDDFFTKKSTGIETLEPLIQRFQEISQADKPGLLIQPSLIGENLLQQKGDVSSENHPVEVQQENIEPVPEDNAHTSLKSQIVEEQSDEGQALFQQEKDISVKSFISQQQPEVQEYQEHPIKDNAHTSLKSQVDEQSDAGDLSLSEKIDASKSFRHSSFIDQEIEIGNEQRVSFHSNIEGDRDADQPDYFLQQDNFDNEGFVRHPDALSSRNSINFQHQSVDFRDIDEQPNFDVEELRLKAADALNDIHSLLASSLPQDIQALSRKISEFQEARKKQHTVLRERVTDIQSRFDDPNPPPSISKYLSDLEKLNKDISKFNKDKLGDSSMEQIDEFQDKLQHARNTLEGFLPQDSPIYDNGNIFPELKQIDDLSSSLDELRNPPEPLTRIDNQYPKTDAINQIYETATDICQNAKDEIAGQRSKLLYSNTIQTHQNDWEYLESLTPDSRYNEKDFQSDLQKLDQVYQGVLEIKEIYNAVASDIAELREHFSEYNQIFKESLGENFQDGWNLLFPSREEALAASQDRPDFALVLNQIDFLDMQIQTTMAGLDQILEAKESMMTYLDNTFKESLALKAKSDLEIQDAENKKIAEQLKLDKEIALQKAKEQQIAAIQNSLDSAIELSEKIIGEESDKAFAKLQSEFPSTYEAELSYILNIKSDLNKEKIPYELVDNLNKKLLDYLDKKVSDNKLVDSASAQEFKKQISAKRQEWTDRPFYSETHKKKLQNLVQGEWGRQIKNLANIKFTNISQDKSGLQESLNTLNQKLDIKQLQIKSELIDLEGKIENLQIKFQEDQEELLMKESQKTSIQQVELAIDAIIQLSTEEEPDSSTVAMAGEKLKTKISETETGGRNVDDIFDEIIQNLQDDNSTAIKGEYSFKRNEIDKEINLLQEKISNGEMEKENTIKIKNQLLSEMKAISDEQIELTNSIRRLEDKRQNIVSDLKEIGIEI